MAKTTLILPALRGSIGDWIYYSTLMRMSELGSRVSYAEEVHRDKALSALVQRRLEGRRARHISDYLKNTKERFFNSLVLATYGGNPKWLEVGNFDSKANPEIVSQIPTYALDTFGFLRLDGAARLFAIDGQHRLAGIKKALSEKTELGDELVPTILVGHRPSAAGLQRTRRLFTTLNKTAVAVNKRDIIALDEDDVMAIVARRMVESNPWFRDPKIAVISNQNIPLANRTCLMTISNLYDVLRILFRFEGGLRSDRDLRFDRPSDGRIEELYEFAVRYFSELGDSFGPVGRLFKSNEPRKVTAKQRGPHGGHLLFRPLGLDVFTSVATQLAKQRMIDLGEAVRLMGDIPTQLSEPPYLDVIWDGKRERMITRGKALAQSLLRHMVGLPVDPAALRRQYGLALGRESGALIELPDVVVEPA